MSLLLTVVLLTTVDFTKWGLAKPINYSHSSLDWSNGKEHTVRNSSSPNHHKYQMMRNKEQNAFVGVNTIRTMKRWRKKLMCPPALLPVKNHNGSGLFRSRPAFCSIPPQEWSVCHARSVSGTNLTKGKSKSTDTSTYKTEYKLVLVIKI